MRLWIYSFVQHGGVSPYIWVATRRHGPTFLRGFEIPLAFLASLLVTPLAFIVQHAFRL